MLRYLQVVGTLLVFIASTDFASGQESQLEQILISEYYEGVSLKKIIADLENTYSLEVDADPQILNVGTMPPMTFKDNTIEEVFKRLLDAAGFFHFSVRDRIVIVREAGEPIDIPGENETFQSTRRNVDVSGKVVDKSSGEALPYTSIVVKGSGHGAISNVDGFFTLFNVPSDTSTLVCRFMGFETNEFKLYPDRSLKNLLIRLQPLSTELDEIIIADKKEHMIRASEEISKVTVSPQQISSLPSLGEKDIFRALQLLPGISATNETSSGLYVRGGTPDQNLVLFDGFTVYHVDHFYGFFSAFNANAIKDVQLYKGGFESKFGGRLSSVVELTGKTGNEKEFSGNVGISAISANASITVPFAHGNGTILLAARRSYTDIIKSSIYNDIFDLFNQDNSNTPAVPNRGGPRGGFFSQSSVEPAFFFHDLNAKISFRPSNKDIVSLSFYNGQDNLDQSNEINSNQFNGPFGGNRGTDQFNNARTDITKWGNTGSSLRWGRQWSNQLYTNAIVAYSNYFSQRDLFTATNVVTQDSSFTARQGQKEDNDLKDFSIKLDGNYLINEKHQLGFGTLMTHNEIFYTLNFNDTLDILDRDDVGTVYASYIQDSWQPLEKLKVVAGIRSTYYDVTEKLYFEPRLSASYQFNNELKFKGAWGRYYQFAKRVIREDVTQGSRDFWLLTNENTNPVGEATHYIVGASYETDKFLFDVEFFYKDLSGLTEYSLRFAGNVNNQNSDLFFNGTGYSRGIEFLVQKKFGKYTGWIGYTLSEAIYDFPDLSDEPYPALHDQTHEVKIINSLRLGRWTLAGTWVYGTGKPFTAPIGGYELTLLDGISNSYISVGEKNAFRLPDYHRMDVSITYHFNLGNAKSEMGLSIFNLYDRSNIWYKTFEVVDDDVITTDVNTIGLTPNLFFNVNF